MPIVIFRGAGDQLIPLAATQDLQRRFAPNATRIDFPDMGHQPALSHYERIFEVVGKLHVQEEKRDLPALLNDQPSFPPCLTDEPTDTRTQILSFRASWLQVHLTGWRLSGRVGGAKV